MSSKQLARAAVDLRPITFHFASPNIEPLTGWLGGMDDYHWMVVGMSGDISFVHKASTPVFRLGEPAEKADMGLAKDITEKFRDAMVRRLAGENERGQAA